VHVVWFHSRPGRFLEKGRPSLSIAQASKASLQLEMDEAEPLQNMIGDAATTPLALLLSLHFVRGEQAPSPSPSIRCRILRRGRHIDRSSMATMAV